jgi:hypothetical protein
MPYRRRVVREGSALLLAFTMMVVSCGGSTTTTSTTAGATATSAPGSPGAATGTPGATGPSFGQVLTAARATEYKVTYRLTATGGGASSSGEQSWFFKPPRARFDFVTTASGQSGTVSIFALPDGAFMCFGSGAAAQCIGMSGLETALQQNPAASFQEALMSRPDQFNGVFAETRQIAGQQANCYDVKPTTAAAGLTDGRFCYSASGIPLLQQFGAQGGTWSMEATSVSTTVADSDFKLPATPTIIGRP